MGRKSKFIRDFKKSKKGYRDKGEYLINFGSSYKGLKTKLRKQPEVAHSDLDNLNQKND